MTQDPRFQRSSRIFVVLIALVLLASLIWGCGTFGAVMRGEPVQGGAGHDLKMVAPFLPPPFDYVAYAVGGALAGGGAAHTVHRRKKKKLAHLAKPNTD